MELTIVGAGAIGGVLGAHLARAGHAVRLVDADRAHVEAIRRDGLAVGGAASFTVRVPASPPDAGADPIGAMVLAVKALHTEAALRPLAGRLAPDGFVVSMQNGLEAERVAGVVGTARTIPACLTFGAYYEGPGRVVYSGPGTLAVGELDGRVTDRVRALARVLADFHPAAAHLNVQGLRWSKLALTTVYFGTATADADVLDLLDRPASRAALGALAGEVADLAAALRIRLEPLDGFDPRVFEASRKDPAGVAAAWAAQAAYWRRGVARRTGIWRDLAVRRRRTEAEPILGALIAAADAAGQPVPRIRALARIMAELESGRRALAPTHLDELGAAT
jgi:2-dehydropantoate 2-reductase